jgi:hypothetical protein
VRKLTAGLLGTAAVAVSLLALRQSRPAVRAADEDTEQATPEERSADQISLERLRARGL